MRGTPFGAARDGGYDLGTQRRFTGQVEDASIGLQWFAARAYDPALGRFTRAGDEAQRVSRVLRRLRCRTVPCSAG